MVEHLGVEESCNQPLLQSDIEYYDTTPDGVLSLNEFDDSKLNCFVDRYVQTENQEIRDSFIEVMSKPLWIRMRAEVGNRAKNEELGEVLNERLSHMLSYEFPDSIVKGKAVVDYAYRADGTESDLGGLSYIMRNRSHMLFGTGTLQIRKPFRRKWSLHSDISVTGRSHDEEQFQSIMGNNDRSHYQYGSMMLDGVVDLFTRDDRQRYSVGGSYDRYFDTSPDHLRESGSASGEVQVSDIKLSGHPLSITGTYSYSAKTYAPSLDGMPVCQ